MCGEIKNGSVTLIKQRSENHIIWIRRFPVPIIWVPLGMPIHTHQKQIVSTCTQSTHLSLLSWYLTFREISYFKKIYNLIGWEHFGIEPEFCKIRNCDEIKITIWYFIWDYFQISIKIMAKVFKKCKTHHFQPILPICRQIRNFQKNLLLSVLTKYHSVKFQKRD